MLLLLMASYRYLQQEPTLFRQLPASQTGLWFNNRITESDSLNALTYEYLYNGGGVGIGDFDNDGLPDVFFSGNQVSSRLYLNKGTLRFEDITEAAGVGTQGWCTGVSVVDINQDGWLDIYVNVAGPGEDSTQRANLLFINQGKNAAGQLHFKEQASAYGLADLGYSTQTAFLDYDHDDDLDAYVLTNALDRHNRNAIRPKRIRGEAASTDRLYRNQGLGADGHPVFKNVSAEAGILMEGYGLGLCVSDLNQDGWEDIYCANDFLSNDLVWINNQDGTFTNQAAKYLKHQTYNAMGVDIADMDNDARPDIMVVDMLPNTNERQKMMLPGSNHTRFGMDLKNGYQPQYMRNTLQRNTGEGTFVEISQLAGVDKTDWSWAPLWADFDNDGHRDLFITNGYRRDITNLDFVAYLATLGEGGFGEAQVHQQNALRQLRTLPEVKLPNFCYRNTGEPIFEDRSAAWGFTAPSFSNGVAYADFDNDGDLDLVINNIDEEAFFYENTLNQAKAPTNHWLRVAVQPQPEVPSPVGTKVYLYVNGKPQYAELSPVRGFVSSVEPVLHFGLGPEPRVDSVVVVWTNQKYQVLRNVAADQVLRLAYQPQGTWQEVPGSRLGTLGYFTELSSAQTGIDYQHLENEFNDFNRTPLLPHKHSQFGPALAVGDVNGDGLPDFYVGADAGRAGVLYLQQPQGTFLPRKVPKVLGCEAVAAVFFDVDGDQDLDLYVVSGGSQAEGSSEMYQDQLYLNDGKGYFSTGKLPPITSSGSCVVVADIDADGDLDLFRGGRLEPGKYPLPGRSFLLLNEGGALVDATERMAPELQNIGLVSTAAWADFDGDGYPELALAGEWMPIQLFKNERGKHLRLTPQSTLPNSAGWWNVLAIEDWDGDGDLDLMVGNLGLNTKYRASAKYPLEIFAADFDQNGKVDPVMTQYIQGRRVLIPPRDLLALQMPSVKKRFPSYASYAQATFDESFTQEEINGAHHLACQELRSMYYENTGQGTFRAVPLPLEVQQSPVFDILPGDFNHDGYLDALLVGNFYGSETIGGWYDASRGTLLLGDGKGGFTPAQASGIKADQDARYVRRLDASRMLVANNGGTLQCFSLKVPVKYLPQ